MMNLLHHTRSFDRYWKFSSLLHHCTIHFSRKLDAHLDLYSSFLESCTFQGQGRCASIITSYPLPSNQNQSSILEQWLHSEFEDLTPIHSKLFSGAHFHYPHCVVQLPAVSSRILENSAEPYDFYEASSIDHCKDCGSGSRKATVSPDYILLPVNTGSWGNARYIMRGSQYLPSKVIAFDMKSHGIYIPCLICKLIHPMEVITTKFGKRKVVSFPLISVPRISDLHHFHEEWKIYVVGMSLHSRTYRKEYYDPSCSFWGEPKQASFKINACLQTIIMSKRGCNNTMCIVALKAMDFSRPDSQDVGSIHVISHAAHFVGVRYSVFYTREIESEGKFNILNLLTPMKIHECAVIYAILILYGVMLRTKGLKGVVLFWLYETMLEQGGDLRERVTWRNWYLILIWLQAASFLRLSYTSAVTTLLTKLPEMRDLPQSFEDLAFNHQINVVTDLATNKLIGKLWQDEKSANHSKLLTIFSKINKKYWLLLEPWRIASSLRYSKDYGEWFVHTMSLEESCRKEDIDTGTNIQGTMVNLQPCRRWARFAMLYSTSLIGSFRHNMNYFKPALLLHVGLRVVENDEPVRYFSLSIWHSQKKTYLHEEQGRDIAALFESGIISKQRHHFAVKYQVRAMETYLKYNNASWPRGQLHSLATLITSRYSPYEWRVGRKLESEEGKEMTPVKINDVVSLLIVSGAALILSGIVFVRESCMKNVVSY